MVDYQTDMPLPPLGRLRLRSRTMTRPLSSFSDIHSHDTTRATDGQTVVSQRPGSAIDSAGWYSVGIHPWDTVKPVTLTQLRVLVNNARSERVVAIGECGLDRLRGADMKYQEEVFRFQARLARKLGKPLVIHCVRAYDILLRIAKEMHPKPGEWILHGFRGKPALARQLLDAGIDISLGVKHHPDLPGEIIPTERLYRESDAQG